jgi:hypothetical protein
MKSVIKDLGAIFAMMFVGSCGSTTYDSCVSSGQVDLGEDSYNCVQEVPASGACQDTQTLVKTKKPAADYPCVLEI